MAGLAVRPISTTEAVVVSLRARILDGNIEPGVRLPELELAADLGVARPTVRAAIQTLCHEGLLVREPNRSAHIPVLTRDEILDLFSVRIPLECLVVRAVLERGASLDGAREAIAAMEQLTPRAGWSQVVAADGDFHHALVNAVGSPRLERLYGALSGEIRLCVAQLRPELGVAVSDRRGASRTARRARDRRRRRRRGAHDRAPRTGRARPHAAPR